MGFTLKLKLLALLPFILIIAAGYAAYNINVAYEMTAEDKQILGFEVQNVSLPERKAVTDKALEMPTLIEKVMGYREAVPSAEDKKKAPEQVQLIVTMIIVSDKGNMAIVNGTVVREGDSVANQTIIQIEPARILVEYALSPGEKGKTKTNTKGTKWVNLL